MYNFPRNIRLSGERVRYLWTRHTFSIFSAFFRPIDLPSRRIKNRISSHRKAAVDSRERRITRKKQSQTKNPGKNPEEFARVFQIFRIARRSLYKLFWPSRRCTYPSIPTGQKIIRVADFYLSRAQSSVDAAYIRLALQGPAQSAES